MDLSRISLKIRNTMFSRLNKEFLIFLFFLALSGSFWLLMALNETYEKECVVGVRMTDVPRNAVITTPVDDTVHVTIRDKGFTLVAYTYGRRLHPVNISFPTYANRSTGMGRVSVADLQKLIYQQLYKSSRIVSVKPDKLTFYFNFGRKKEVPVRLDGTVTAANSYYLSDVLLQPKKVTIYANDHLLDSIKYVSTEKLRLLAIDDTVQKDVSLAAMRGVKIVPSTVRLSIYPDILTEESFEVPVHAINMPEGKVLRTFPQRVNVRFVVGASRFRSVHPEQFVVVADYRDIAAHPSAKCKLYLRSKPRGVMKAHLDIQQVDYLIEQQ